MKRSFVFSFVFSFFILLSFVTQAQDRELEIHYIAHDHYGDAILKKVDDIFNMGSYMPNRVTYLYLANANNPIILKCDSNNQKGFEKFKEAIGRQLAYNIWPEEDIKRILELLRDDDFIDDDGKARYSRFSINFYTTPSFWTCNYNETLIARLFWVLELSPKSNVHVSIYYPEKNDGYKFNPERMFGPKRLNGDNEVFMFTY